MGTPQYIRVAGQLYRRREEPAEFIKHAGWLFKLAETASENVAAIEALTMLANLSKKIAGAVTDKTIGNLMQQASGELGVLAKKLTGGDYQQKSSVLKDWDNLKAGLSKFAQQAERAKLTKISTKMTELINKADSAVVALKDAEGLGAEFTQKSAPGLPSKEGPSVDWGEHAPKQQQQMQASTVPAPVVFDGMKYIPVLQITKAATAWATSREPSVVAKRQKLHPLAVRLMATGPA